MKVRTFTDTLHSLRFGKLADECTSKLRELVAACDTTGRGGALTLTIALKPGKGGQIEVFDDIKLKLPKEERGSSLMFSTPEFGLQRNDPRQQEIEGLRSVDAGAGEIRDLKHDAA